LFFSLGVSVTTLTSRPFAGADDFDALLQLLAAQRFPGAGAPWHAGDLSWQLLRYLDAGPIPGVRLWFEDGVLAALGMFEPPLRFIYTMRAGADAEVEQAVIAWAVERRRRELARGGETVPRAYTHLGRATVVCSVHEADTEKAAALDAAGFERRGEADVYYLRDLRAPMDAPPLPAGFRVRHATADDIESRAALHADAWSVWGPSSYSAEAHSLLRAAPLFREDLDVVVEAPGGVLASYALGWFDPATQTGNLEPVGTRPSFAGMGLGRAAIVEVLRRLKELGAVQAHVSTAWVNDAGRRLYPAAGFEEAGVSWFWAWEVG